MRIFWAQGFEGASVDTLSRGMGVPRASLYNLFGDKERLFLSSVQTYAEGPFAEVLSKLERGGSLDEDLAAFFTALIQHAAGQGARGCLVSCVLSDAAGENDAFRAELARQLGEVDQAIAARLGRAVDRGDLRPGTAVGPLAHVIGSVARGITVAARAGTSVTDLMATAAAMVALLPTVPAEKEGGPSRRE